MKQLLTTLVLSAGSVLGLSASAQAEEYCGAGKPVTFAGIDWESGAFVTAVMQQILAAGLDCKVDAIPGNSVTLEQAVAMNDVQIFAEEWIGRSEIWNKAAAEGKVTHVGHTFEGAVEGWFVPAYVIEGDPARGIAPMAPDLKAVSQLSEPQYVELFQDREEPGKGRFLNCPSGWTCEGVSSAKLEGYGLDASYVNFRPGTGTALDAAIASAYLRGEPLLFYYWTPTALMGKYRFIQLDEPPYSDACWAELTDPNAAHDTACAFPQVEVAYGINTQFEQDAPEIVDILKKAVFPLDDINESLAYMKDEDASAQDAAERFLRDRGDIWRQWVSQDQAAKIAATLE